ncbi:hypothetical protein GGX14DRAFT_385661 [Mycena pura]|uniref:Uncharacterized protein n=1 Tax=Mycena pura TaxID=153505 RepID=A0AAD6YRP8_9AGAR|nr:hypothetical protein GGX14DRAFT_385661 [Mycena pura]
MAPGGRRGRGGNLRQSQKCLLQCAQNAGLLAFVEENFEAASNASNHATSYVKKLDILLRSYLLFVEDPENQLDDHEQPWLDTPERPLTNRVFRYFVARILASQGRTRDTKETRMSYQSLQTLRQLFLALMAHCIPDQEFNRAEWDVLTDKWMKEWKLQFKLRGAPLVKMVFGLYELLLLVETALDEPLSYENAIQHICSWIIMFTIGSRPSSLFVSPPYPDYMKQGDVKITRGSESGDYTVEVTVRSFKGWRFNEMVLTYNLRPPREKKNLHAYLGAFLVALGLRRGEFAGFETVYDIEKSDLLVIPWKNPGRPLFGAGGARGWTVTETPLTSNNARMYLHHTAQRAGINGSVPSLFIRSR